MYSDLHRICFLFEQRHTSFAVNSAAPLRVGIGDRHWAAAGVAAPYRQRMAKIGTPPPVEGVPLPQWVHSIVH